jgi:hypothetical protein
MAAAALPLHLRQRLPSSSSLALGPLLTSPQVVTAARHRRPISLGTMAHPHQTKVRSAADAAHWTAFATCSHARPIVQSLQRDFPDAMHSRRSTSQLSLLYTCRAHWCWLRPGRARWRLQCQRSWRPVWRPWRRLRRPSPAAAHAHAWQPVRPAGPAVSGYRARWGVEAWWLVWPGLPLRPLLSTWPLRASSLTRPTPIHPSAPHVHAQWRATRPPPSSCPSNPSTAIRTAGPSRRASQTKATSAGALRVPAVHWGNARHACQPLVAQCARRPRHVRPHPLAPRLHTHAPLLPSQVLQCPRRGQVFLL